MKYSELIEFIEDEQSIIPEKDYYYHAFVYEQQKFLNMVTKGIKAPILLGKIGNGHNGPFYVSLSKKNNSPKQYSVYNQLNYLPMFIIDENLNTIKAQNFIKVQKSLPAWIQNSPLPFRETQYDDEYQKFLKVSPNYIVGIEYNLQNILGTLDKEIVHGDEDLFILKDIISTLQSQNLDLPIIDYSSTKQINKEKVLSLHL